MKRLLLLPIVMAFAGCAGPAEDPNVDSSAEIVLRGSVVELAARHDSSPPLALLPPAVRPAQSVEHEVKRLPRPASHFSKIHDSVAQTQAPLLLMPATSINFLGMGNAFSGPAGGFTFAGTPPDTNGDVGPNHYVQTVNTDFAIFNKSGTAIYGPVQVNTLFSGFGGGCETNNDGDPVVLYDPIADRWVISQFSVNTTPYLQCVAVSVTGDPTGSYHRYAFDYGSSDFPDYPKMGVWPDGYYTSFNIFAGGSTFSGPKICAYDRTKMLSGAAATQQCFSVANPNLGGMLPSDMDGTTVPPAGSPNYVLALGATSTTLAFWKFHVDWTTPANSTLTGPTNLTVAAYAGICSASSGDCVPQPGSAGPLQGLDDRLMFRNAYRNFGDHQSIVVTHAISSGSSSGIRWYELRIANQAPSIFQQGTYAPDANYRWLGSAAQDRSGNMALGFSISSTSVSPSIRVAGRLAGDAAGTLGQGETTVIAGGGSQTDNSGGGRNRWGDYASMSIDPTDDCTFWFTTEYMASNGGFSTWSTRVASFKFPGCGGTTASDFSITASPATLSLAAGGTGTSTIGTTLVGSAGTVNLAASVSPAGPTASLSASSISAGSSSTLTINAGTAAAGTYTVTVTGTEGTATHSATVAVTIAAAGTANFSIAASPSTLSVAQGSSGTSNISTAVVGNAGTVSLATSSSPAGLTASISPASVAAGGSATVTVNAAATTAAGSYTVTVTGTEGAATHSVTIAVTVTAVSSGGALTNGGFESGLTGWTSVGTTSAVANSHTGSGAAQVGGTAATNGDSSISQAFTAPSGATQLSFWYQVHCPDTLTYDWVTATLLDTTANTTTTPLAKTCTNAGAWVQATTPITAGHSYKLTLTSHDDNYAGDPTYAWFDDVSVVAAAASDFSITVASPKSVSAGGSVTAAITTAVTSGAAESVSLSATGLPTGVTASFSPAQVTSGSAATLTLSAASTATAGSYTVTITGAAATGSHSAALALTVTAAAAGGVTNGGFETGSFSGWTTVGTSAIVTTGHSGAYAARLGGTSQTNGDSSASQTFTAPAGSSKVSFWYRVTCPDTVTYDWATATLKDNTAGSAAATVLAKTCVTAGAWTQVSATLVAGHSYTLTLTSHDDNYAGDATYTQYDDVVIQ